MLVGSTLVKKKVNLYKGSSQTISGYAQMCGKIGGY